MRASGSVAQAGLCIKPFPGRGGGLCPGICHLTGVPHSSHSVFSPEKMGSPIPVLLGQREAYK